MIQIKSIIKSFIFIFCNIFSVDRKEIPSPVGSFRKPCEVIDADDVDMNIMPVINGISGLQFIDFLKNLLGSEYFVTASECLDAREYFIECLYKNAHGVCIVDDPGIG